MYGVLGAGSGSMGEAIAYRLLQEDHSVVFVSDQNPEREKESVEKLKKVSMGRRSQIFGSISGKGLDVLKREEDLPKMFENLDIVISALPAALNLTVAEAVVVANEKRPSYHRGKTHYCDLGGVLSISKKIIFGKLARRAEECEISLVLDCGFGPGLSGIKSVDILGEFDLSEPLESLIIYMGGLPEKFYKKLFNLKGLE